ncbi:MAG TPA: hypothetical protein VFU06_15560 [Longimicrobiales bacterium]|nr:hypothetical protein [Longimicrobiales bacterium]
MLTLEKLGEIQQTLAGGRVLTAYIAAEERDPTERSSWRRRLAVGLDAAAADLDDDERRSFDEARDRLEAELAPHRGFLPGRGWVAFVTPGHVALCAEVPAPMPDLVRWRDGAVLGPLLRALKQNRPVLTVLIDSRRARVLRYVAGELTEETSYRADTWIDDLTDVNSSKRGGTTTGMRGETGSDVAERIQREEMERLVRTVADALRPQIDSDTLVLIGGSPGAETTLHRTLQPLAGERVTLDTSLHVNMTTAQLQPAVERTASALSQQRQLTLVREVIDSAGAHGRGMLHAHTVERACRNGQVATLLISMNYLRTREDLAEELISLALTRGGTVELVGDEAGELLDHEGGGVGARLRYVPSPAEPAAQ